MDSPPVIFGQPAFRHGTVESTQDIARAQALAGAAPAGAIVTARFQTHGRGRQGRAWYAPPDANVCMTVIAPPVALRDAWQTALVAGIAVAEGVMQIAASLRPALRFPNDVLVGGAKLSGVLVETMPSGTPGRVIPLIGIGVNVLAAAPDDLPPEVRARAIALESATGGVRYGVSEVEAAVLARLTENWHIWTRGGLAETLPRWRELADPNARRGFELDGRQTLCRIVDLNADGIVTLETESGERHRLPASLVILGDD